MPFKFNPLTSQLDLVNAASSGTSAFITEGTNGISKIRLQSTPTGNIFDLTISDLGALTTNAVGSGKFIVNWFTLIPQ